MLQQGRYHINLQLSDLKQAEEKLYEKFVSKPLEILNVMEEAVKEYVLERKQEFFDYNGVTPWQVCIVSDENPKKLR